MNFLKKDKNKVKPVGAAILAAALVAVINFAFGMTISYCYTHFISTRI